MIGARPLANTARPAALGQARQVWVEVVERRREWARQAGDDHFEGVPASDHARWLEELSDAYLALADAMSGHSEVDPRAAAIDVMAVAAALVDVMGDPQPGT